MDGARTILWLAAVAAGGLIGSDVLSADLAVAKVVNDATLMPGAAVEFTVTVANLGPEDQPAVEVLDQLPPGLVMPIGTAPFLSQGRYEYSTGLWQLDDLGAGSSAVMVLPAQVDADPLPPCLYNEARIISAGGDTDPDNDVAFATLRQPGITRCFDLGVAQIGLAAYSPVCSNSRRVRFTIQVYNRGPDPADQVVVSLSRIPRSIPGLKFQDTRCLRQGEASCELSRLAAGQIAFLDVVSSEFKNNDAREVTAGFAVTSVGTEIGAGDEISEQQWTLPRFENCSLDLGSGASECFIATAAYGSSLHPRVQTLRKFRDRYLLTHGAGRVMVAAYYRWSPPVADYIADRPSLRAVARGFLWPLVLLAEGNRLMLTGLFFLLLFRLRRWCMAGRLRSHDAPVGARGS